MQHIFIAEIDGKEIDMTTMMQEEKQKVEYLLEPGYKHLHNCKINQTALIRKLMEVQRNGQ